MSNYEDFLESIADGLDIETACYLNSLSPYPVYALLERGKKEQERLGSGSKAVKPRATEVGALNLWEAVNKARAVATAYLMRSIRTADDWKAQKFLLEHLKPQVFATDGSVRELEAAPLGEIEVF